MVIWEVEGNYGLVLSSYTSDTSFLEVCDVANINGNIYLSSQIVVDTLIGVSATGCDSIHITNLTVNHPIRSYDTLQACISAVINGRTYTSSTTVTDIFTSAASNGCDSMHITNLTINQPSIHYDTLRACDSIIIDGTTYTTSRILTKVLPGGSFNSCDSINIINLVINTSPVVRDTLVACIFANINGVTYTSSQVVTNVFYRRIIYWL